jgi:hypothetical protein
VSNKFVILRCLGRTKPVVEKIDDVRDELHKDVYEKKMRIAMAEEFDRLKEDSRIENFLTPVSKVAGPPPAVRPASHESAVGASRTARPSAQPQGQRRMQR